LFGKVAGDEKKDNEQKDHIDHRGHIHFKATAMFANRDVHRFLARDAT
jgi:hypothetical protein